MADYGKTPTKVGIFVGIENTNRFYTNMLTDAAIKRLKPPPVDQKTPDKYTDAHGLQLHVFSTGRMTWIYAYRTDGKQRSYTIGKYPTVSLADARRARDAARQLIEQGIDPNQTKRQAKREENREHTFEVIARRWLEDRQMTITAGSHKRNVATAEKDIFPAIGHMAIDQIKSPDILAMARKVEARGAAEMARRAISLTGQVFRQAMCEGLTSHDPTTGLHAALKPRVVRHMARISATELPKLLNDIEQYQGDPQTRIGLKLVNLCFVRTKELRFMEWADLDLDAKLWRISAEKMKKRRPHIIPLSSQAIELLEQLRAITGHTPYVFQNLSTRKPYSEAVFISALNRMGYKGRMTGHGFRGLASTILHEQGYMHAAIEIQLAHVDKDAVSAAYNHADHLPYRTKMMQEWADYLDSIRLGQIVAFPKVTA
jgi:integrase